MKKMLVLLKIIVLIIAIVNVMKLVVKANDNESKTVFNASNYAEMHYSRDGIEEYDGWLYFGEPIYVNVENILTPNGNQVEVYETLNDLSAEIISDYNNYFDMHFPNATRISTATARYNCHSYAWYSQSTSSNNYWMNNPGAYYSVGDMSYIEVTTPRPGDIICYYDNNGTPNYFADDENLHSGIVVNYNPSIAINNVCGNSNQVTVVSKWGAAGLYQHIGDYCPYTSTFSGTANYVRYYRPRTNETFNLTNPSTNNTQTIQRNYSVPQNNNNTNNYAMYELDIEYRKDYEFEVFSNHELDIRLYDEHMQLINTSQNITYENGIYTYNIIREMYIGTYYLRVAYDYSSDYGTITTSIINAHNHYYHDHYSWQSFIQHKAYCACGAYANRPHVTPSNAFQNGEQYAECSECHGLASVGIIYGMIQNGFPYTLNGSFILPNGVIVLMDEDYEAYVNDTLVFIIPNDNIGENNSFIPCLIRKEDNYWSNVS